MNKIKQFFLLLKHDFKQGILNRKSLFIGLIFIVFIFFIIFYKNLQYIDTLSNKASILDSYLYLLHGMKIYVPSPDNPFDIPIIWLFLNSTLSFIIFGFITKDLSQNGCQLLIRTSSRGKWWLSKVLNTFLGILLFYSVIILLCIIFALISGNISFEFSKDINQQILDISINKSLTSTDIMVIFLIPIISSITTTLLQILFELFFKPLLSIIILTIIHIFTAYFFLPIFNLEMMIERSNIFIHNGYSFFNQLLILLIFDIIIIYIGYITIKRKDIINFDT